MDAEIIGGYVREAREMLGLSPVEFGEMLGLTRQTVWRYETGDPIPRTVRIAIAGMLNTNRSRKKRRKARSIAKLLTMEYLT